jgi:sarcosine oxidase subunit delta
MLQITCPFCGRRDEEEFSFGGESHIVRPSIDCGDAEWADYLFCRENRKGVHCERWAHSFGCGRWFNVVRDTVTHDIHVVYEMGESRPALAKWERD